MTAAGSSTSHPGTTLATIFGRLYENEFATLDGIAISQRVDGGMHYIDETVALQCWLQGAEPSMISGEANVASAALHQALFAALPDHDCVISGWSRHLRALLLEDLALPEPTSMMRKRGISDLAIHVVEPSALVGAELDASITRGRDIARDKGMRHVLLVTTDGLVVVAGSPPFETMAHWHNIEFAARVACMALEDAAVPGPVATAATGGTDAP